MRIAFHGSIKTNKKQQILHMKFFFYGSIDKHLKNKRQHTRNVSYASIRAQKSNKDSTLEKWIHKMLSCAVAVDFMDP